MVHIHVRYPKTGYTTADQETYRGIATRVKKEYLEGTEEVIFPNMLKTMHECFTLFNKNNVKFKNVCIKIFIKRG